MDTTTIIVIIAIIALIGFYLYNRSRPAPRGTYDDKDVRSGGSIGGGTRAHDDENVRSSGSIGGGTRAHNSPQHSSGGTIGGGPTTRPTREEFDQSERTPTQRNNRVLTLPNGDEHTQPATERFGNDRRVSDQDEQDEADRLERERAERRRKDSEEFRSGGSFGGSAR